MGGKRLTRTQDEFIVHNWATKSFREIADAMNCSVSAVINCGKRHNLPPKVAPSLAAPDEDEMTLGDIVDTCISELRAKRAEIKVRLDALGRQFDVTSLEYQSKSKPLFKAEEETAEQLYELEKIQENIKPPRLPEFNETPDALFEFLNEPEQRKKDGIKAEKMRIAANNIRKQWMEPMQFAHNEIDSPLLTPENPTEEIDNE